MSASDDPWWLRGLKDVGTGGLNEIPGVHSMISGQSNASKAAQAQQHQNFQDAIAAYAEQRQKMDAARLDAMRQSMGAMQPTSTMLQRMGLPGLNLGVQMPADRSAAPPPVGPQGIAAPAAMGNQVMGNVAAGARAAVAPQAPLAWGGPLGMRGMH
jgi:hypothetical protein